MAKVTSHDAVKPSGETVLTRTEVSRDSVDSTVTVTDPTGNRTVLHLHDDFFDDDKDFVHRTKERVSVDPTTGREQVETLSEEKGLSVEDFLEQRGQLLAAETDGVEWGLGGLTYSAKYSSAALLSTGSQNGNRRHVLSSLGVHDAFPFPGEHWDEGQIAILDEQYDPILTLRMPKTAEKTHLDVSFEDIDTAQGPGKRITYQGYMEDDEGKLRFVQADYELSEKEVKRKNPSLWDKLMESVNKRLGYQQNAKLLRSIGATASSLRIDGKEVLKIETTQGTIDDHARFNNMPNSKILAINYAPKEAPLLSTFDLREGEARYVFDSTLLMDTKHLLKRILPRVLRRGILAAHYTVDSTGQRRGVSERMRVDDKALSEKYYVWKFKGEEVAVLRRELVRCWDPNDPEAHPELGFRETIVRWEGSLEATIAKLTD